MIRLPTKGGSEFNKKYHAYYYKAIDLKEISAKPLESESILPLETEFYIEKFLQEEGNDKEIFEYPLPSTVSTYQKPYLTPERHRDYAIFWGSCTSIGVITLLFTWLKKI